jgi:hypothetical protein
VQGIADAATPTNAPAIIESAGMFVRKVTIPDKLAPLGGLRDGVAGWDGAEFLRGDAGLAWARGARRRAGRSGESRCRTEEWAREAKPRAGHTEEHAGRTRLFAT